MTGQDAQNITGLPRKIALAEKLSLLNEYWSPRIIAELNDQHVRVARLKGAFIWHRHEHEDELFLVLKGRLAIRFRDGEITLDEGEMCVVPRGVEHLPVADDEVYVLLFEPASTVNTGNVECSRTLRNPELL